MDLPDVHLLSSGTALPGAPISNAELAERFGGDALFAEWADTFVGTRNRHFSVDLATAEVRFRLADLGRIAAEKALDAAGLTTADVDVIVMGTSSPDQLMPATVNVIADQLGINNVPTYQLQSGCTGAVQALDVAQQALQTGRHRTALVIGGDTCTKHLDLNLDPAKLSPSELVPGLMFGDGAGAAVLSTTPTDGSAVLRKVLVRLTGLGRKPGHVVEWYGPADLADPPPSVGEDYKAIEESVPTMAVEILEEMLDDLDWKDVDYLLPPQLSGKMTDLIVKRLALPDAQEVSVVAETANTGNALPFFQLERLLPRLTDQDRAVAIAVESSKWIKGGLALEKVS
ncbi:3-oxoacyl-[acyl-carrier-protein] synthase 3 [Actinomadura rubteroloni]|uniref:3-oxoacyl-[acyl-carrier-protein] synthase 3 n=1 Tax=Actinomadura rubteroloni TaxID=1926885 RepID=A0A2P4UBX9_9ACTN|nr:3-oxoacyl-ACP synthase III family protein [Actinomadura rubteroloni]POM22546.1 3-oxoacyl-[acyl-carrier-protein] synthase 3 [Actinomadura rubteroloni]